MARRRLGALAQIRELLLNHEGFVEDEATLYLDGDNL
jgi:hypothetical protein